MMPDKVEYYLDNKLICAVESSMVPQKGQAVSIRGETFVVDLVSFAVDYADDRAQRRHCANVRLVAEK